MKAKVFIASSVEGLEVARAIQANIDHEFEITVWTQDIFKLSADTLESLLDALGNHDFGIFVFSPDDEIKMRDEGEKTVRDNVIFELGLFVGRNGKDFNFIVQPRDIEMHIPSDLYGITTADYATDRTDKNLTAALGKASTQISNQINELFTFEYPEEGRYGKNLLSKDNTDLELDTEYSFRARLKHGQKLRVKIKDRNEGDVTWYFKIHQMGDWYKTDPDRENGEQYFELTGPSDSDLSMDFKENSRIDMLYYENSDQPTFFKEFNKEN